MRPIESKILSKITDKGVSFDEILEWVDSTTTQEMKKSFPDDCHFQTAKYFAKVIVDSLVRQGRIVRDGNKFTLPKKENKGKSDE
ncbi:MAG TPA: hypothetical protein PLE74_02055 [Candidatus Cloacimonadota bacterium]|nr:hypothetical protein [Candidatus Cloacimonadota bacterium]HPT71050.1 hypothetical protein [Candidatus Cloacimonadota bacterium]